MRVNTNKYIKNGSYVEIHTKKKDMILIDIEDFNILSKFCWYVSTKGYAYSRVDGKHITMHRLLMDPGEFQVDHINRNKLDNRKCNLRLVTNQQNQYNTKINVNNTSGIKGVYFNKVCNKWCAQINLNGKTKSLGLFEDIEDAKKARVLAEKKYYKL